MKYIFKKIETNLINYNANQCKLPPTMVFDGIFKCVKKDDLIVGGISGDIELLSGLHIKTLWLDAEYRGKGMGSKLLNKLENEAIQKGAKFSYLETFDFQAKDFYINNGYKIFSKLDFNGKNTLYFMKKEFS